jgi:hypothetical protein
MHDDGAKAREIHRDALTLRIIRIRSLLYRTWKNCARKNPPGTISTRVILNTMLLCT